jgi:glycosyltransferase involved in cell wall biosynthesis
MLQELPLVSVLMTAFNRERYITGAIKSILASSYENFELIIVDDCSTDQTFNIAKEFAVKDKRIRVYINERNLGDYPNRNKAATYAKGKYLKYVDADDLIYPYGLSVMVSMMEQYPKAGFGLCTVPQNNGEIFPIHLSSRAAYEYHYINGSNIFLRAPLSSIISRTLFEEVGGFKPNRMVSDFEMWHRLALNSSVVLMPQGLIWYRNHDEQEMGSHHKFLLDYLLIAEFYVQKSPLSLKQREALLDKIRRHQFIKLVKNPMKLSMKERIKFFKSSNISFKGLLRNTSFHSR